MPLFVSKSQHWFIGTGLLTRLLLGCGSSRRTPTRGWVFSTGAVDALDGQVGQFAVCSFFLIQDFAQQRMCFIMAEHLPIRAMIRNARSRNVRLLGPRRVHPHSALYPGLFNKPIGFLDQPFDGITFLAHCLEPHRGENFLERCDLTARFKEMLLESLLQLGVLYRLGHFEEALLAKYFPHSRCPEECVRKVRLKSSSYSPNSAFDIASSVNGIGLE